MWEQAATGPGYDRHNQSYALVGPAGNYMHGACSITPGTSTQGGGSSTSDLQAMLSKKKQQGHGLGAFQWATGGVVGVCADLDKGVLWYTLNGEEQPAAFVDIAVPDSGLFPVVAITCNKPTSGHINFGRTPFTIPMPVSQHSPVFDAVAVC